MAWSAITSATQLTTISDTIQWFDEFVELGFNEIAHVEVEYNPVGSPTDDLTVHVQRTLDDASENWDDVDYLSFLIPNDTDPAKRSFNLEAGYKYRVGVQSSGTTDDHTSADMSFRILSP